MTELYGHYVANQLNQVIIQQVDLVCIISLYIILYQVILHYIIFKLIISHCIVYYYRVLYLDRLNVEYGIWYVVLCTVLIMMT